MFRFSRRFSVYFSTPFAGVVHILLYIVDAAGCAVGTLLCENFRILNANMYILAFAIESM